MGKWICKQCGHEVSIVMDYQAIVRADFVCTADRFGEPKDIKDGNDAKKKIKEINGDILAMVNDRNYTVEQLEHSMYQCLNCGDFTGGEVDTIAEWKEGV